MGSVNGPGTPVVHRAPQQGSHVLPCCGMSLLGIEADVVATVIPRSVTCDGNMPTEAETDLTARAAHRAESILGRAAKEGQPMADAIIAAMKASGIRFGDQAVTGPAQPEPPAHGEPGHTCLPTEMLMDINDRAERVVEMVRLHRERLLEAGLAEAVADAMAAQYHMVLLSKVI